MPYFINVGRFEDLKGVIGSRGWHIWRRGRTVHVRWGAIEIDGRKVKRFHWAGTPVLKSITHRTEQAAMDDVVARIHEKTADSRQNAHHPYQKLPTGQKIVQRKKQR
jgi:hypothetical protein